MLPLLTDSSPRVYKLSKEKVVTLLNNDTNSDMYYPDITTPTSQPSKGDGREWHLPERMAMRNGPANISGPQYPLRASFFKDHSRKEVILTNHFEYGLDTDTFYEYKIIDLDTKNRKRTRQLIETAITDWTFLKDNQDSFATNYIDTIVSWKPLHHDLDQTDQDDEWPQDIVTTRDGSKRVRFKYVRKFYADTLREYASADPSHANENFEDIARCLNIVISKGFGSQIHKLSSNRFFVKSARSFLWNGNTASNQLELIRGYFYNVKPGMGNIILNFNVYTSAVFRPIRVDQFLSSNNTFAHDPPERLESVLKGKAVYLILDRKDKDPKKQKVLNEEKSRYWKVWEIQSGGYIENLWFTRPVSPPKHNDDGTPVTETVRVVAHHLASKFLDH
jgi:eukaryotic translation initiation factor 2C